MKQLILLLALALSINAIAQDADKTVTLVVSGQGKTQDEAKQVALRSAIEQAFGAFISSKTEILNDSLVKDEIVSVTNGNIQKFDIISEVKNLEGGYATTLKAIVSVTKLTSFCESKGVAVEFKGGLFAINIKQQLLNEKNEVSSIKLLSENLKALIENMFDYSLASSEPISINGEQDLWALNLSVGIKVNDNFPKFRDYLVNTLTSLSLSSSEFNDYLRMNKPVYQINLKINDSSKAAIYLRSEKSTAILQDLTWYFYYSQSNFAITDGIREYPFEMLYRNVVGGWGNIMSKYEYPIQDKNKEVVYYDRRLTMNGIIIDNRTWSVCLTDIYNPPSGFDNTTYALVKKDIYENTQISNKPQSWDNEELLNWKAERLKYYTKICADSVTCFTYSDEGIRYGFPECELAGREESIWCQHNFGFNLNPPKNEYGKFEILLKYKTDELAKITSLTVKPYLTLMLRKY